MPVAGRKLGTTKLGFFLPEYHFFGMNAIFPVPGKMHTLFPVTRYFVYHVECKNKKHSSIFWPKTRKNGSDIGYRNLMHDIPGIPDILG